MYKAIIFDLDGTLLDTLTDIALAANRSLEEMGYPTHNIERYKTFVGDGVEKLIERCLPATERQDSIIKQCCTYMKRNYARMWPDHSHPYPGILEMLSDLHQRDLSMAILSNKVHDSTNQMVKQLLPAHLFQIVRGAQPHVPIKPDPTAAIEILHQLKVAPSDCLYLGDTNTDMQTGINAGMVPIGVLWGFREQEELIQSGAHIIIKHPSELHVYLEKQY